MSILGGVLWAALYLRKGIGGGDSKLALSLGTVALASGWLHLFGAIAVASALTVGLCILTRQRSAPHGPSMLIGTGMFTLV